MSIERPNANDEPDFCRGDAKTLARIAELTESHDNLTKIIEALKEAHGWATVEGIYLCGDLPTMINQAKFARFLVGDQIAEVG
jgi:hypothetical protein